MQEQISPNKKKKKNYTFTYYLFWCLYIEKFIHSLEKEIILQFKYCNFHAYSSYIDSGLINLNYHLNHFWFICNYNFFVILTFSLLLCILAVMAHFGENRRNIFAEHLNADSNFLWALPFSFWSNTLQYRLS